MRILRVAQKVYPTHIGGGAYHVHALSRDQAEMGHDVTVLTFRDNPDQPAGEMRDGYRVVRVRSLVELIGNALGPGIYRCLAEHADHDVVHAHSHLYFSTNVAALRQLVEDRPLAITNHGLYSQSAPQRVFDPYLKTLGRWTLNCSELVFCYTEIDEQRLRKIGVDTEIAVVANGINPERFCPDGPVHASMPTGVPVALVAGRLVEGKNPDDALTAVEQVRERGVPIRLVFCGDGPARADLEARVKGTDREPWVTFLGHVPYDEMPHVYRGADLLVQPSRAEGFPRTVLEAFASEVPAVTSALPQLRPVVETAGRTAPLGDVTAIADRIHDLLDNPELRARLGRSGRELVTDRFRWSETVRETTDRLEALVDG
ncbi:MAG: glycosyltransferase family 4 protein [Haloarculaceae archaeon]